MIALENVSLRAGTFHLESLSFTVSAGGYAALMGKTGVGKTTLLEAICGLRPIQSGRILLQNRDVSHDKPAERGIGYVPQDRALFQTMTVWEHLAFALTIRRWDRPAIAARVEELADWLGLEHLLDRLPHGLSGGEAQRVALGRALSGRPRVLLLDEPLSALDAETRTDMFELLHSVRRHTDATILHVTHDLAEAQQLADAILILHGGTVQESEKGARTEDVAIQDTGNGAT
jgi:ABC-type sugar transport system ATPase subunit